MIALHQGILIQKRMQWKTYLSQNRRVYISDYDPIKLKHFHKYYFSLIIYIW